MDSLGKFIPRKRPPGCRRLFGCMTLFIMGMLLLMGLCLLAFFVRPAAARQPVADPFSVWLLIDNSNSMFEKAGIGSDPDLLRLDAARLFLTYLGVDDISIQHQAAVIFFGSAAETAVPLTLLTHEEQRTQLFAQIANPPRQGWTDHLAALDMAQEQLNTLPPNQQAAIILLTDGKPEWSSTPSIEEQEAYQAALRTRSALLTRSHVPLFIILLASPATDSDPAIATIWEPLWQEMSAATPSGTYFVARSAEDLPGIYHDIVALLTGNLTQGIVYETAVPPSGAEATITVPQNLTQLTLVISKEDPSQTVQLTAADGRPLTETDPTVRKAGGNGRTREEIWVIEQPPAGEWTLHITGAGAITIWQDGKPAPILLATEPQTATLTVTPAPQPTKTAASAIVPLAPSGTPASIPTAAPTASPVSAATLPPPPEVPKSFAWLWAGGAGVVLVGAVTSLLLMHHAGQRPYLGGTLCLLEGARTANGTTILELESFRTRFLRLGQAPADIHLSLARAQVTLSLGVSLGEATEILVCASGGQPLLDGVPLIQERRLLDTAVLDLDGVQLRYENLKLRQAQREQARQLANQAL